VGTGITARQTGCPPTLGIFEVPSREGEKNSP
jgi:hypothetical protein